jgi:hypothetical protein
MVDFLMQEHRSLIKRASAWNKEKTARERQHQILKHCDIVAPRL